MLGHPLGEVRHLRVEDPYHDRVIRELVPPLHDPVDPDVAEGARGEQEEGQYDPPALHGGQLEGTDQGPSLTDISDRLTIAELAKIVKEGKGRMPGFDYLDTPTYRGVLGYMLSPGPIPDEPSKEVRYALGGYVYLKDHEGLPGNSPPWGTLNSIDLGTGDIAWSLPLGNFLSHPDLGYGAINYGGPVVTASGLIFIAATPDKKFRAFDTRDGSLLWEAEFLWLADPESP